MPLGFSPPVHSPQDRGADAAPLAWIVHSAVSLGAHEESLVRKDNPGIAIEDSAQLFGEPVELDGQRLIGFDNPPDPALFLRTPK